MNKEKIIEQYVERAILYGESFENGENFSVTNKHYKYIAKYYDSLRDLGKAGEKALLELLNHPNLYVRFCVASQCLTLNENKSKQVLQEIKQMDTILGVSAELLLASFENTELNFKS
ncbi:DUF2019 domain-containing protein [Bacillus sp. CGMCC 1.60114]|uniref:DUF2019 domain-containing protein n=1 Tax=unclassified Bacillus (in: firmicutes) TaxID=185979 RepID=UPI00363E3607